MAGFNFADSYRAAQLAPTPDMIRLRQEAFDSLRAELAPDKTVTLVRLYFGLPTTDSAQTDWFRDGLQEKDPSFSMIDNEREVAVLAACLLKARMEDENDVVAGLALLTSAASGLRSPVVLPMVLDEAQHQIRTLAIKLRARTGPDIARLKPPAASKIPAAVDALLSQAPDIPKSLALLKQAAEESNAALKLHTSQSSHIFRDFQRYVASLHEELEMLWWYVGGWSNVLETPFAELARPLAAVMAGADLASLTHSPPGPVAAPAIFHRLLAANKDAIDIEMRLDEVTEAVPATTFERLTIARMLPREPDICPILNALQMAAEFGDKGAWHTRFQKTTGIKPDVTFKPVDLAMQVYREALLLPLLGNGE